MELSEYLLKLTAREIQILGMVAEGMTGKEIANHFAISRRTVEKYQEEIKDKLGAKNQAHALTIAYRSGIIA